MLVRHFALILNLKMNLKQVAPVPWMPVRPLFSTSHVICDVEDEPLSGLVDNPGAATVSISSELNSFLLIMCIGPPESTTNLRSSGLVEVGAAIALAQIGVQNVALSEYSSLHILFAKSHAALRAHLSWCKVSSCDLFPNFGAQGLRS